MLHPKYSKANNLHLRSLINVLRKYFLGINNQDYTSIIFNKKSLKNFVHVR